MRNLNKIYLFLTLAAGFGTAVADSTTDWYEVTVENRPYVRWWWLGSAVDQEGLTFNLEEFARKGLGGVEITPIYGVKGNEANDIPYLSDRWMDMLAHTTSESARLGLQVDMNNGTGWPFGGPDVTLDHSARKLITAKWNLTKGERIREKIRPADEKQAGVARLLRIMACNGDKRIDITDKLRPDSTLAWKAPKGDWTVYALFSGRTFQKVKRAAPGGEGYVLNHYDSISVKKYLDKFDKAFAGRENTIPVSFFNDSYEVYGSDWTDNLLEEFEKEHGYKLESYLPEFLGTEHNDTRARVIRDYRETLGRLLYENFTKVWTDWAHSKGATIRNQSHGSPANIIDLYAAVDIPECESFGQTDFNIPGLVTNGPSRPSDSDPAVLKFASSAAHLAGKPLTSAETLTWLTEHFRTSLSRCKPEIDQMFCSGVNHVFFHGAPYSPAGAEFPGWMFYASINMSPTNTIWNDADALFSYIARVQAFLSAGSPDNDFMLYFPIEDIWHRQGGNPYLMFDIHKMYQRMPDVKQYVADIIDSGYDVDYVSDRLLDSVSPDRKGHLVSAGDNMYRGVIVPNVRIMSAATLKRLIELAENGGMVIFVGSIPSDVPGLSDLEGRRSELQRLVDRLPKMTQSAQVHKFGKGEIITAPDMQSALALTGVTPETIRTDNGARMIRRRNEAGGHNYFISMLDNRSIDGFVTLADTTAVSAMIFDPLTGKSGKAVTRKSPDGKLMVQLQLLPGQSVLVKTFPVNVEVAGWIYTEPAGEPIALDRNWTLQFLHSEPAIEGTFDIDTVMDWTKLPDENASRNFGTGRYTVKYNLDDKDAADDWMLDLGDIRESARVTVNGTEAGTVWAVPFSLNIGHLLHNGENEITVDVTSLQANRIADFERNGVEWRRFKDANIASVTNAKTFSFGDWDTVPAGLLGPVRLIPLRKK